MALPAKGANKYMMRVNIGCGQTPTDGWRNFDNSLSVRLCRFPLLPAILRKTGLLDKSQYQFIRFARANSIEYGDVTKGLPLPNDSVDVLYSSHMLEHLDQNEAVLFLREARRVLRSGGIIRLAIPDLRKQVLQYIETNEGDAFISATLLTEPRPRTIWQRIKILLVGTRHHQWMYDGISLSRLLQAQGFTAPVVLNAGESLIENPQNLDLYERASESVYVEAIGP
jgi:predicted SAM-dependent methyltransferase